jgi:hypothetical protein
MASNKALQQVASSHGSFNWKKCPNAKCYSTLFNIETNFILGSSFVIWSHQFKSNDEPRSIFLQQEKFVFYLSNQSFSYYQKRFLCVV